MTRTAPEIVLISGYVIELDSEFIRAMLSNHRFQLFMLGAFLLLVDRLPFPLIGVERWQAFSLMTVVALILIGFYCSAILTWMLFPVVWRQARLRTAWVICANAGVGACLWQNCAGMFTHASRSPTEAFVVAAIHLILFVALELVFALFVLPDIDPRATSPQTAVGLQQMDFRRDEQVYNDVQDASSFHLDAGKEDIPVTQSVEIRDETIAKPDAARPHLISLAGQQFDPRRIRSVTSQDHYVSIMTVDNQTKFVRGRMRDLLMQMPEGFGFNIHRSHWVSWKNIKEVLVEKDMMLVVLDDDTRLPVARGRKAEFNAAWLRRGP